MADRKCSCSDEISTKAYSLYAKNIFFQRSTPLLLDSLEENNNLKTPPNLPVMGGFFFSTLRR